MKINYRNIVGWIFIALSLPTHAQFMELKIGDTIGNIELRKIVNYKSNTAKLYDFKNDLLILDFWASWCSPCVAMFPKTDSIQKEFSNRVQFLPISYEDSNTVADFLNKMKIVKRLKPVSIVNDHILSQLFPHNSMPHYVWINSKGVIIAITGLDEINRNTIKDYLSGKQIDLAIKTDSKRSMDIMKTAFTEYYTIINNDDSLNTTLESLDRSRLMYHSVFTKEIPGNVHGYSHFEPHSFTAINVGPLLLVRTYFGLKKKYGYNFNYFFADGKTILDLKDTMTRYILDGGYLNNNYSEQAWIEWGKKHAICYELVVPDSVALERKEEIMGQDLRRYFNDIYSVDFGIEERIVKQLVLKRTSKIDKLKSQGGKSIKFSDAFSIKLQNQPPRILISLLTDFYRASYPIYDETGLKEYIDIELTCKITDVNSLNNELKKYNLHLVLEDRPTDVLVVRDLVKKK
jgi:thiol-disulfide isomerase/thioredoxin